MVASGHVMVIDSVRPERLTLLILQSLRPPAGDSFLSVHTREVRAPMPAGMPAMFIVMLTSHSSPVSVARALPIANSSAASAAAGLLFIVLPPCGEFSRFPDPGIAQ